MQKRDSAEKSHAPNAENTRSIRFTKKPTRKDRENEKEKRSDNQTDHCVRELAALIEKDGFREYVRLLARETARELRPKLEAVKTATDTASCKEGPNPAPETHAETIVVDSLSALAAELKQFLAFRDECDERAIISAVFDKFHCKNVDLAEILGVTPNMIAKVKMGLRSPTLSTAIRKFMENEK